MSEKQTIVCKYLEANKDKRWAVSKAIDLVTMWHKNCLISYEQLIALLDIIYGRRVYEVK